MSRGLSLLAAPGILLVLVVALAGSSESSTQTGPYPRMAPLSQYLIPDRNTEIALAETAAPAAISHFANILVLEPRGYVMAKKGGNGFTCLVERAWMSPFDDPGFWNPRNRSPVCYNPPASRSVLLYTLERTKLVLAGLSKTQLLDRVTSLVAAKKLPPPEPGSMSYMMSKVQYLNDAVGHWHPHLMFHVPKADGANDGASWGANLPDSPVVMDTQHTLMPEPETIFFVPVGRWSDGTAAPKM